MRVYILALAACLCAGCVPELAQTSDLITQRCALGAASQARLVKTIATAAAASPEPVPAFVVKALDDHIEAEAANLQAIAECAAAQTAWQGPPAEPVEAGSFHEKATVSKLKRKGKIKTAVTAILKQKLGLPATPGAPAAPATFPWQDVLSWGAVAVTGLYGAKKTRDAGTWKAGATSLSKALGRLKKNGTEKKVLEATGGDDVPAEERAAGKAAYRTLKSEGAV